MQWFHTLRPFTPLSIFALVISALSFVVFASPAAHASVSRLAEIQKRMQTNAPENKFYKRVNFSGSGGYSLSALVFGAEMKATGKATVVVSPGMSEPALKYAELAVDLMESGYGPVIVMDHRGHGFSENVLADPEKIHVDNFQDYVNDFHDFYTNVVKIYGGINRKSFLIAHSMGSAIASLYSMNMQNPFAGQVYIAPMFKIKLPLSKKWAVRVTNFVCMVPFLCRMYLPGRGGYDDSKTVAESNVTSSAERFAFDRFIRSTFPETKKGSATFGWLQQALLATDQIQAKWQNMGWHLLILEPGSDIFIDTSPLKKICADLPKCKHQRIAGAKHEILQEKDEMRTQALNSILHFFAINL